MFSQLLFCADFLVEERQRNSVALVEENSVFLEGVAGVLQVNVYFSGIYGSVPDPHQVLYSSVLALLYAVVYVTGMHEVFLAGIVGRHYGVSVVYVLPFEHTVASEPGVLKHYVQLGSYVLCSEDLDVGLLLLLVGEQCSVVVQFRVGRLCVVLRKVFRSVAPYLIRGIEDGVLLFLPLEVIVQFDR